MGSGGQAVSDSPALVVDNLSYAFGRVQALDGVSFGVHKGECTILLGPNGAGKSTLFALITRLYDSRDGQVVINGFNVRKQSKKALAQLGVVFQQPTLDLDLNVMQNLRYHASLHGISRRQATLRIQEELERQGMYSRRSENVRQLNGGHRRRVEIARALLHRPSVLLLDEPTVGLDVPSRGALVGHVHELCRSQQIAVLWATHLIDEIDTQDHLIVLHRGKIRAKGKVEDVIHTAGTETVDDAFRILTTAEEQAA